mmetsp:Transcript_72296/g.131977  ORF Transcript_72296/g.131977 Transcript_72296/m.131977 type:complete len:201 (-) Transcript_72296:228-830(-)
MMQQCLASFAHCFIVLLMVHSFLLHSSYCAKNQAQPATTLSLPAHCLQCRLCICEPLIQANCTAVRLLISFCSSLTFLPNNLGGRAGQIIKPNCICCGAMRSNPLEDLCWRQLRHIQAYPQVWKLLSHCCKRFCQGTELCTAGLACRSTSRLQARSLRCWLALKCRLGRRMGMPRIQQPDTVNARLESQARTLHSLLRRG